MSSESPHIASVENEFALLYIKDDLLYLIFKPGVYLDHFAAFEVVADRIRLQGTKDYYVVCDTSGIIGTTHAAREYLAGTGSEQVLTIAFAVNSRVGRTMLLQYLKDHNTPVKTAIFDNQKLATKHLKTFL